jgi:RNA polymerase sigma-70 factor, ECF subfamily
MEADDNLNQLLIINLNRYFDLVVLTYQQPLYMLVFYILQRHSQADDIVQETFVHAYEALAGYSIEKIRTMKLRPWLFRIAHNLSLNFLQRDQSYCIPSISMDVPEGRVLVEKTDYGHYASPEEQVEEEENRSELNEHLRRLPESMRTPIILYYHFGLSYPEIAEVLQLPIDTVKSSARRGKMRLKEMLKRPKYTDGETK